MIVSAVNKEKITEAASYIGVYSPFQSLNAACGFLRNLRKRRIEETTCRQYQSLALKILVVLGIPA